MHFVIEMDAVVAPTTEMAAICVIEPEQKKEKVGNGGKGAASQVNRISRDALMDAAIVHGQCFH